MKTLLAIVAAISLCLPVHSSQPAQPVAKEIKSWWTDASVTTFGAIRHADLGGKPQWGAGVDLGYNINKTVSLHVENLAYERNHWGDTVIDETSFVVRADLIRYSNERLVGYILASGDRDWWDDDWGFGAGAGLELRLTRNASIGVDSRIRAWFDREKDVLTRGFVGFRF